MFKNKKTIYILIPVNLAVWTYLLFQVFGAFGNKDIETPISPMENEKGTVFKESKQYVLNGKYEDPFLKDIKVISNGPKKSNSDVPRLNKPMAKPKPEIQFFGLIKNTTRGETKALIAISGQSKVIKLNEVINGVVFKTFHKDSLIAKFGAERFVIHKNLISTN